MYGNKDISDMIDILTTAIAIHEKEEEFFRRSAGASASEPSKALYMEIAHDLNKYGRKLENKKGKLVGALLREQQKERGRATAVLSV